MRDFERFEVITFDCYGTLIDWETGILRVLRPLLQRHGHERSDAQILERYAQLELQAESSHYKSYRKVLRNVVVGFAADLAFEVSDVERRCLEESLADWQAFPDTAQALGKLATRYRLGVLSNVDDDLFTTTAPKLGVKLDHLVTAQQVGAYKPSPQFFHQALEVVAAPKHAVLHVAQSLHHDVAPARRLGIATVWVNRRHDRDGFGATVPSRVQADLEVPDLQTLVSRLDL